MLEDYLTRGRQDPTPCQQMTARLGAVRATRFDALPRVANALYTGIVPACT